MSKFEPDVGIVWGNNPAGLPEYPYYVKFPGSFQKVRCRTEGEAENAALDMQRVLQSQGVAAFVGRKDLHPIPRK